MELKPRLRLAILMLPALWGALLISASRAFAAVPTCSEILSQPIGNRSIRELPRLRIMTYNVENFFTKRERAQDELKSPTEIKELAEVILDQRPDIVVLQEVQSKSALELFSAGYLKDRYESFLIEGNDERGIDVGFMVKKDLALVAEMHSHKDAKWLDPVTNKEDYIFSRDLPALILRETSASQPSLIIFANHGKSKRDRAGDPESKILRGAQIEAIAKISREYAVQYGPETPIIVAGDFNTDVRHSPEIRPLKKEFVDAFDVGAIRRTGLERATHTYHPRNGPSQAHAMDGVFINNILARSVISARVFRYRDDEGVVMPLPRTYEERDRNPSDHFPVVVDFDIHPFLR